MGIYINDTEKIYPRFPGDIQLIDSTWDKEQPLPNGWEEVEPALVPELAADEALLELWPVKIDGVWHQQFEVKKLTQEELDAIKEELAE